jgi:hypothetical protein
MAHALQRIWIAIFALCIADGCTHRQLRWNTVKQSGTLTDIYEQQVLDNLAMFVHDPGSLPCFAYPSSGGSDVIDEGAASADISWLPTGFNNAVFRISGRRNMKGAWILSPVSDPRRLELMRCAYQRSVARVCSTSGESMSCPDCDKLFKRFYLGNPSSATTLAEHTISTGKVTAACLGAEPWFAFGCKRCAARRQCCTKIGHYCGTYVWVLPGGQDELSKLTLTTLDYATNQPQAPPTSRTKEVTWYFTAAGAPTTQQKAEKVIHAVLPYEQPTRTAPERGAPSIEMQIFEQAPATEEPLPMPFAPPTDAPWLLLDQQLRFLTPQDRGR